jgi:hypothetical protein
VVAATVACGCTSAPAAARPKTPLPAVSADSQEDASPWSKCYEFFIATGDPTVDIGLLGRECGSRNNQRAVTPVREGKQSESDAVDRFTFTAGGDGKCYRVFAVGERGVRDLDVQLVGPDGEMVASDMTKGPYPVVPAREPACLPRKGIYTVEVSVYRGSGRYAVQVWGN